MGELTNQASDADWRKAVRFVRICSERVAGGGAEPYGASGEEVLLCDSSVVGCRGCVDGKWEFSTAARFRAGKILLERFCVQRRVWAAGH